MRRPVKRAVAPRRPPAKQSNPQLPNASMGASPGTMRGETVEHRSKVAGAMRRVWVLDLARAGMTLPRIVDAAPSAKTPTGEPIPMDASEVHAIYSEYLAELKFRWASEIPAARAAQLDRLFNAMIKIQSGDVVLHKGVAVPGQRRVNWFAYLRCEREVALILGTHAPKVIEAEVNVNLSLGESMHKIVSGLTPEEIEELADEAERDRRDAETARHLKLVPHEP